MKKFFSLILIALLSMGAIAQQGVTVSGTTEDQTGAGPITVFIGPIVRASWRR